MNLLDSSATKKQHVERIEMMALLKDDIYNNVLAPISTRVDCLITNNILTGMDLKGKKRSDFDDLESCVYSYLVEIGRGDIDMGQVFKSK